jgi:hypothetical protein
LEKDMNRFGIGALSGVLVMATVACTRDSDTVLAELKKTNARLDSIEKKLDAVGRARPQGAQPRPERPKPGVLYAVPVNDNDAYRGGKHAKVTVVEAFEYA